MKKLLILLLIFVQNSLAKHFMIVALPRSGSTFFAKTYCSASKGKYLMDPNKDFYKLKEFFTMGNCYFGAHIMDYWGCKKGNMFECLSQENFDLNYDQSLFKLGMNASKEVMSYGNISHYHKKFDMMCLIRKREHTFPSSMPQLFILMYQAFLYASLQNENYKKLRTYLKSLVYTDKEQQCAGYIAAMYVLITECKKYGIPILRFEKWMTLKGERLDNYFKEYFPKDYYNKEFAPLLEKTRSKLNGSEEAWLKERKKRYEKWGMEPFMQKILSFIKTMDSGFDIDE